MELFQEILVNVLKNQEVHVLFPNLIYDVNKIIETECYKALKKIKEIVEDDTLDDKECFAKIEEVVCTLEGIGSDGGNRHDFG